jgi:hypothetical protein
MRPTRIWQLGAIAAAAAIVAAVLAKLLVLRGLPILELPRSLLLTLPSIAIVLAIFGWPMLRYRRALKDFADKKTKQRPKRPDSFYAVRVLLLAKAAAIAGALFFGWLLGVVLVQLGSPVAVWQKLVSNTAGAVGSLVLVVVALLVERACRLPDDADNGVDAEAASA